MHSFFARRLAVSAGASAGGWSTGGGRASGRPSSGRGGSGGRGGGSRRPPGRPPPARRDPPPPDDPFADADPAAARFFATCHPGAEAVLARALTRPAIAAATVVPGRGGVFFTGDAAVGYAACLWLRTAIRVLRLVAVGDLRGPGRGGDRLYAFVRRAADWAALVPAGATLAVDARVNACTDLATSLLAGQMARNAVLDAVRDATGARPPPPEAGAQVDVPLFLAAHRDTAWLYRDMVGGGSLHRRGYRAGTAIHKAALNEAAAAVVLELAGWADAVEADASSLPVLADPMCGSGTLLIEAALMARRVAPGLARGKSGFPFVSWPDHDPAAWLAAGTAAKAAARPDAAPILLGNDAHAGALALAAAGAAAAGVDDCVSFTQGDAAAWRPRPRPELVVTNPPWGKRLDYGDDAGSGDAWPALGAFLRAAASPGQAYVVSGDPAATRGLRMKAAARTPLSFGGEEVRVLRYEVLPPREAGEGGGGGA